MCTQTLAHSGGTDRFGCHAGSQPYHCHNSNSGSSSGSSSSSLTSTGDWSAESEETVKTILTTIAVLGVLTTALAIAAMVVPTTSLSYESFQNTDIDPTFNFESKVIGLQLKSQF